MSVGSLIDAFEAGEIRPANLLGNAQPEGSEPPFETAVVTALFCVT
jgi:hypothetical protein